MNRRSSASTYPAPHMTSARVAPSMWGTPKLSRSTVRPARGFSVRSTGPVTPSDSGLKKSVRLASVMAPATGRFSYMASWSISCGGGWPVASYWAKSAAVVLWPWPAGRMFRNRPLPVPGPRAELAVTRAGTATMAIPTARASIRRMEAGLSCPGCGVSNVGSRPSADGPRGLTRRAGENPRFGRCSGHRRTGRKGRSERRGDGPSPGAERTIDEEGLSDGLPPPGHRPFRPRRGLRRGPRPRRLGGRSDAKRGLPALGRGAGSRQTDSPPFNGPRSTTAPRSGLSR